MGRFRVEFGPLPEERFHRLLPDKPLYGNIEESIRFYVDQPLDWDIELIVKGEELQTLQLGEKRWGQLGWNTWVFSKNKSPHTGKVILRGNC